MGESAIDARRRSNQAAEELPAEGHRVTNRAVRERAGVVMTIAAEAAHAWHEHVAEQQSAPDLPNDVRARLDKTWVTAYVAARQEFDEARVGCIRKVEATEKDVAELTTVVAEVEQRCKKEQDDQRKVQAIAAQELTEVRAEMAVAPTRAAKFEGSGSRDWRTRPPTY